MNDFIKQHKADWLRSEIDKLEGIKIDLPKTIYIEIDAIGAANALRAQGYNQALTYIITRYKEELLELDKTNGF